MHQRKYALEFISEVGLSGAKLVGTLIDVNVKLTSKQDDIKHMKIRKIDLWIKEHIKN